MLHVMGRCFCKQRIFISQTLKIGSAKILFLHVNNLTIAFQTVIQIHATLIPDVLCKIIGLKCNKMYNISILFSDTMKTDRLHCTNVVLL